MPDKRTLSVLGALVTGMTVTSVLLLILEPGPVAPVSGVTLRSVDQRADPQRKLFSPAQMHAWQAIVIHDSGALEGSSRTLNHAHEQAGRGGLGYHFVVNNGSMEDDGLIEIGFRWQRQFAGAYVDPSDGDWYNRHAIGVCLIGDADRRKFSGTQLDKTLWLVQQLQRRFGIPKERVFVDVGRTPGQPARLFPYAWFEQQLLTAP